MNITQSLSWAARRFGARDALVFEQRRWSYSDLERDVHALVAGLRARGLMPGDRVAVVAGNSASYLILALALAHMGAVLVPLNCRLRPRELALLVQRSGAVGFASETGFEAVFAAVREQVEDMDVKLDLAAGLGDGFIAVTTLIDAHSGTVEAPWPCSDASLLRVMYTSGTTSAPKGVQLSHGNCWANMHAHAVEFALSHEDRLLLVAPLYHVGGFDIPGLSVLHAGGTLVVQRSFEARQFLRAIEEEAVTGTTLVATMMSMILEAPEHEHCDVTSLRWIITGQFTPALYRRAAGLFSKASLREGYGMTESCGGVTYMDAKRAGDKPGSVGLPVPGVEIVVADQDGEPLPTGETGEILLRGPKICAGYVDDPDASAAALRNGWLHSGDAGRFDEDGFLYVQDRIKDMIRSGGENMSASEIEQVLISADSVADAAVIGVPDPRWVEVPAAFLVAETGASLNWEALMEHCSERLSGFKIPREFYLLDELPRNESAKVQKSQLRTLAGTRKSDWSRRT